MNPTIPICISNRKGLTLLENMIALLIFTVVLLGAAAMQVHSSKIYVESRRAYCNDLIATEYLESILALPFDDPLLTDPDNGYAPAVADHGPFRIASGSGTIEWEVEDRFPIPDAKRLSITIRSNDHTGRRKLLTYEYMKTRGFE